METQAYQDFHGLTHWRLAPKKLLQSKAIKKNFDKNDHVKREKLSFKRKQLKQWTAKNDCYLRKSYILKYFLRTKAR